MKAPGKRGDTLILCFITVVFAACACSFIFVKSSALRIGVTVGAFVLANILPLFSGRPHPSRRIRLCNHGTVLLRAFVGSVVISVLFHLYFALFIPGPWQTWAWSALVCVLCEAIVFWHGIICVYCTSFQLGVKLRTVGLLLGLVPVANLVMLKRIVAETSAEVDFETEKEVCCRMREGMDVCRTRYPILLVHGVFFRDSSYINYWGRIPAYLIRNGATVYYGEHQSAASVEDSAKELAERVKEIVAREGCGKVNVIAHSKGGLDCRCMLTSTDAAQYIASVTTVNSPHRGCRFADYLLEKAPEGLRAKVEKTYNSVLRLIGDHEPDFMAAVTDLTSAVCIERDARPEEIPDGVYVRSIGSRLNGPANGKFPLNMLYGFVKHFDGPNDGLVGEDSFKWGEDYTLLTVKGKRGISHGDVVDMNRENIPEFDVREFYVGLVAQLKKRGL